MRFKLYKNGVYINTVVGEESFVQNYANENGFTYEFEPVDYPITLAELEAENKLLKAQVLAMSDRNDFMEECIAEMATLVYTV